jgi:hypothetical protein
MQRMAAFAAEDRSARIALAARINLSLAAAADVAVGRQEYLMPPNSKKLYRFDRKSVTHEYTR